MDNQEVTRTIDPNKIMPKLADLFGLEKNQLLRIEVDVSYKTPCTLIVTYYGTVEDDNAD